MSSADEADFRAASTLPELVTAALTQHAERAPNRLAIQGSVRWTYYELLQRARGIAHHLRRGHGLSGGRVLVSGTSQAHILAAVLGTWSAGLSAVVAHHRSTVIETRELIGMTRPAVTLALEQSRNATDLGQTRLCDGTCSSDDPIDIPAIGNECLVLQTSGTSGRPRAVSVGGLARGACVLALLNAYQIESSTKLLLTVPAVHSSGLTFSAAHLVAGSTIVMPDRFGAQQLINALDSYRPTTALSVPTTLRRLDTATQAGSLHRAICMGAPLPPVERASFFSRLPDVELVEYYGCTEHPHIAWRRTRRESANRHDSELFHGTEVKVVDDSGTEAPHGEPGLILVRGPFMMNGYLDKSGNINPPPPWVPTGDRGIHSGRRLTVIGRADDVVLVGGVNIQPAEVEARIRSMTGVRECAVVGIPDPDYGSALHAFYEADDCVQEGDVAAHCRSGLTSTKMPRAYHRVDTVPITSMGKPRRALLRDQLLRTSDVESA